MEKMMHIALQEAKKGIGWVNPNPMVGAVITQDNEIIATGYHQCFGGAHAEVEAIKASGERSLIGSTLYVTLEPCHHYGKTPPCTEAIIKAGIQKVVVGTIDPNPLVSGKGIEALQNAGIEVVVGVLETACRDLNEVFNHFIKHRRPLVIMKYAMTLDGKIAMPTGESQWITGEAARQHVHKDRHKYMGILSAIGTVLKDNPLLSCRHPNGRDPIRIICDTHLKLPIESQIALTAKDQRTLIATASKDTVKRSQLEDLGCEIIECPISGRGLDLNILFDILGTLGIDSVYVEGGSTLNASLLSCDLADTVHVYMGAKMIGGKEAFAPVGDYGIKQLSEAKSYELSSVEAFDNDILAIYKRRR